MSHHYEEKREKALDLPYIIYVSKKMATTIM